MGIHSYTHMHSLIRPAELVVRCSGRESVRFARIAINQRCMNREGSVGLCTYHTVAVRNNLYCDTPRSLLPFNVCGLRSLKQCSNLGNLLGLTQLRQQMLARGRA